MTCVLSLSPAFNSCSGFNGEAGSVHTNLTRDYEFQWLKNSKESRACPPTPYKLEYGAKEKVFKPDTSSICKYRDIEFRAKLAHCMIMTSYWRRYDVIYPLGCGIYETGLFIAFSAFIEADSMYIPWTVGALWRSKQLIKVHIVTGLQKRVRHFFWFNVSRCIYFIATHSRDKTELSTERNNN